ADRAGFARGDRVQAMPAGGARAANPLASASPDHPLTLLRERARSLAEVRLLPAALPPGERRMMVALLAVASGFVVLGGWVWSERRDALTRTFFLLCLAFAWLLAPLPRWSSAAAATVYETLYAGITFVLPALCVHFFALFPECGRPRARRASASAIADAVALVLF